jgi:hypothetical protein
MGNQLSYGDLVERPEGRPVALLVLDLELHATVHLPYDICISLLSNAESIYILFIVNAMNVAFKSNVTGRH